MCDGIEKKTAAQREALNLSQREDAPKKDFVDHLVCWAWMVYAVVIISLIIIKITY